MKNSLTLHQLFNFFEKASRYAILLGTAYFGAFFYQAKVSNKSYLQKKRNF
ncbi:MAG: hypothetical protein RL619_1149 [Bacteroidota bacterium]|jgi:hypothetical protein